MYAGTPPRTKVSPLSTPGSANHMGSPPTQGAADASSRLAYLRTMSHPASHGNYAYRSAVESRRPLQRPDADLVHRLAAPWSRTASPSGYAPIRSFSDASYLTGVGRATERSNMADQELRRLLRSPNLTPHLTLHLQEDIDRKKAATTIAAHTRGCSARRALHQQKVRKEWQALRAVDLEQQKLDWMQEQAQQQAQRLESLETERELRAQYELLAADVVEREQLQVQARQASLSAREVKLQQARERNAQNARQKSEFESKLSAVRAPRRSHSTLRTLSTNCCAVFTLP